MPVSKATQMAIKTMMVIRQAALMIGAFLRTESDGGYVMRISCGCCAKRVELTL